MRRFNAALRSACAGVFVEYFLYFGFDQSLLGRRLATPAVSLLVITASTSHLSPIRSPLLVADHLIELAKDKVILKFTRNGDILSCVSTSQEWR